MTKTLDISPQLVERARQLTHASSDEEAIVRAVEAFAARGEAIKNTTPAADLNPKSQAALVQFFGTFKDFMTPEELDAMREMD